MNDFLEEIKNVFRFGATIAVGMVPIIIAIYFAASILSAISDKTNEDTNREIILMEKNKDSNINIPIENETSPSNYISQGDILFENDDYMIIEEIDINKIIVIQK